MTQPRLLGGRYELDGVVGRGGMAEVYRARDLRLDRIVGVKTLRDDLARDQTFQARFRREAQSAASLNHPSIVAVYDTGEDMMGGAPVPYIVLELVDGRALRDLLRDDPRPPPRRAGSAREVPAWAGGMVLRAMQKAATARYQRAGDMRTDTRRALWGARVPAQLPADPYATGTRRIGQGTQLAGATSAIPPYRY